LKEWQDLVLEYGFAYGHEGTACVASSLMITTEEASRLTARRDTTASLSENCYLSKRPLQDGVPAALVVHGHISLQEQHQIAKHAEDYHAIITAITP